MRRIFVVAGPSGVGKGTIVAEVLHTVPGLRMVRSYTTRSARPDDERLHKYHFVDVPTFRSMVEKDQLLEHAEVHGQLYGTPKDAFDQEGAEDFLMELDVQGALAVSRIRPDAVLIFVQPPSLEALRERLRGRHTDQESSIEVRLAAARVEMDKASQFDYVVVNDQVGKAVAAVRAIIASEREREEGKG